VTMSNNERADLWLRTLLINLKPDDSNFDDAWAAAEAAIGESINEEVDLLQGSFYLAVEGRKVKLILDESLPKPLQIAMQGKPQSVTGKSSTTSIEWAHKVPVQSQSHRKGSMKSEQMIEAVLGGKDPCCVVNEIAMQSVQK